MEVGRMRRLRLSVAVPLLVLALAGLMLISSAVGAVHLPFAALLRALVGRRPLSPGEWVILSEIRLPRICASGLAGSALATAGLLMQGLFRNPMADPYVTGASGGATLGAALGLVFLPQMTLAGFSALSLFAFVGALGAIALVYWIARVGTRPTVVPLLLAGFAISTVFSYSMYFVEALDQNYGTSSRVLAAWLQGAITAPQWSQIALAGSWIALATCASLPLARSLNALALGDEGAQQLGVNIRIMRIAVLATASLLTAFAVSLGGLISFVGLVVPHICRMLVGPDHLRLLPVVALSGAILLIAADTLARTLIAPAEIPVGVLMAMLGAPFFLYLLRRSTAEVYA